MAAVGLRFDLSAWKKGVSDAASLVKKGLSSKVLKPFDTAVRKTGMMIRTVFGGIGKFIKAVLASAFAPLIALFAVAGAVGAIKDALTGSLAAYREYNDSVTTLQGALRTLGEGVDVSRATESAKELGNQLRLTMGIAGADTNNALATMLTRGFSGPQARQLTILAANFAKKTGKPLQDVAKQIADAANGSADAIKELGVQITPTGNRIMDAEAAVLALKASYGDIGAELANPSERLAAAWGELAVSLGEKISPIIEPLVQGFADFVTGLTQTEQGRVTLDKVGETLAWIVETSLKATSFVVNFGEVVKGTAAVVWAQANKLFNDIMAMIIEVFDFITKFDGGTGLLSKALGIDTTGMAEGFREGAKSWAAAAEKATGPLLDSNEALWGGKNGAVLSGFNDIMAAGKASREQAAASLSQEMAATRNQTFAGRVARGQGAGQREQQQGSAVATSSGERGGVRGNARFEEGQQIVVKNSVRLINTRNDPFRKGRGMT